MVIVEAARPGELDEILALSLDIRQDTRHTVVGGPQSIECT
jgi:hypothetical protein